MPPVVEENQVTLGATSVAGDSSGNGILATLTFEFIAIKESTLNLSGQVLLIVVVNVFHFCLELEKTIVGVPRLWADVNLDGVVNILDLHLVASSFGKSSLRRDKVEIVEDINNDGCC